jgi:hypothetical protein
MNVRYEPEVRPTLDPGEPTHSLKSKVKQGYEIPKAGGQFRIPRVGRVETLHHQESQIHEMRNLENLKQAHRLAVRILGVGGVKSRDSSTQESRSAENVKCKKSRNRHINRSFRYRELQESRVETLNHRSPEVVKFETQKHLFV